MADQRVALVCRYFDQIHLMFVIEWSPLHRIFYLQYLSALTLRFCNEKDKYLDAKPGCRCTVRRTTCLCPAGIKLCVCQGTNQRNCGRTYSFGEVWHLILHMKVKDPEQSVWNSNLSSPGCILQGRCCFWRGQWDAKARRFRLLEDQNNLEIEFEGAALCLSTYVNDICDRVAPDMKPKGVSDLKNLQFLDSFSDALTLQHFPRPCLFHAHMLALPLLPSLPMWIILARFTWMLRMTSPLWLL